MNQKRYWFDDVYCQKYMLSFVEPSIDYSRGGRYSREIRAGTHRYLHARFLARNSRFIKKLTYVGGRRCINKKMITICTDTTCVPGVYLFIINKLHQRKKQTFLKLLHKKMNEYPSSSLLIDRRFTSTRIKNHPRVSARRSSMHPSTPDSILNPINTPCLRLTFLTINPVSTTITVYIVPLNWIFPRRISSLIGHLYAQLAKWIGDNHHRIVII